MRNLFVMMAALLLLGGCNSVTRIGGIPTAVNAKTGEVVEEADVYSIVAENVAAPNWSQSAVRLPLGVDEDGIRRFKLLFSAPMAGPPITTGMLSGATNIVASYLFGHELDPSQYNSTTTNSLEAEASGVGNGGTGNGGTGNGGAGGAGENGHQGGHGDGENPGHEHEDEDD